MRISKKKVIGAAAVGAVALTIGGVALAYWTNSGSGSGTATTGTTADIAVNQTSAITGLYPGGQAQTLSGNFDNNNASAVFVESVSATSPVTVDSTHATAGCLAADYVLGGTATVHAEVPHGTSVGTWTGLTIRLADSAISQDACKGATVTIAYTSN